jgi:hypothetical protein
MGKTAIVSVFALAVVGALAGSALANTLGPYIASIADSTTDWSGNMSFPQFSPSLGTLSEVVFYISSTQKTTLTIQNNAASPSSGSATTEVQLSVLDPGNYFSPDVPQLDFYSPAYAYSLASGGSVTSGLLTKTANNALIYVDAGTLNEFTGLGNIALSASTFTQTLLANNGGNTSASQATSADATGEITYFYTPAVPEPGTLVLLGTAGIGLLAYAWRRRRS